MAELGEKRRAVVSENAVQRSKIISEFVEGRLTRENAALALQISERQVSRWATRYKAQGVLGCEHGNFGQVSPRRTPELIQARVVELAKTKYLGFNFRHFHEMLHAHENLDIGYSTLKRMLKDERIAKRRRRASRRPRKHRDRYPQAGLMIQMDGSEHRWLAGQPPCVLIAGIDDATSEIPYGVFVPSENLEGYLLVIREMLLRKGLPGVIYVDHASWLSGTNKYDESGQFGRICKDLGISLIYANSPQAKGRVERLWQTLQDRLIAELAYHRVDSLEKATSYLNDKFLPETWNVRFTVPAKDEEPFWRVSPSKEVIEQTLAYKYLRVIRYDHTVLWDGGLYKIAADLGCSIANRQAEIRLYSNGTIRGFFAGRDLELTRIQRPGEKTGKPPKLEKWALFSRQQAQLSAKRSE